MAPQSINFRQILDTIDEEVKHFLLKYMQWQDLNSKNLVWCTYVYVAVG